MHSFDNRTPACIPFGRDGPSVALLRLARREWNDEAHPVVQLLKRPQSGLGTPDLELVRRARAGDDIAFRALMERYEPTVAGVVIRMLGTGDEADDVGQETFIRFHRSLHRFRGDSTLGTYLTRIAMNLSLNALTRRKRMRHRHVPLDHADAEAIATETPDEGDLERAESAARIGRALDDLSPKHRAVVVLRMMEDRSTAEVSKILGVPQGTVMSRLKRALAKLALLLEPEVIP